MDGFCETLMGSYCYRNVRVVGFCMGSFVHGDVCLFNEVFSCVRDMLMDNNVGRFSGLSFNHFTGY